MTSDERHDGGIVLDNSLLIEGEQVLGGFRRKKKLVQSDGDVSSLKPHKRAKVDLELRNLEKERRRKAMALQMKKRTLKRRKLLLEQLKKNAADDLLSLMKSSRNIGEKNLTRKQSLKLALKQERAGLPVSEERLYREKEQIIDLSNAPPIPTDDPHTRFIEEYGDLLPKGKKKKVEYSDSKVETTRVKKSFILYADVEDSEEDEDGDDEWESSLDGSGGEEEPMVVDLASSKYYDSVDMMNGLGGGEDKSEGTDSPQKVEGDKNSKEESSWIIPDFSAINRAGNSNGDCLNTATSTRKALKIRYGILFDKKEGIEGHGIDCGMEDEHGRLEADGGLLPSFLMENGSRVDDKSAMENESRVNDESVMENESRVDDEYFSLDQRLDDGQQQQDDGYGKEECGTGDSEQPKEGKKAYYVTVNRTEEVMESRSKLPIIMEEADIMEAVRNNDFVIICGETGSGKTTQVPQFLYEAGYGDPNGPYPGMIGVTEPRRIAAISTAKRVAYELNQAFECEDGTDCESFGHVAYQVRYDSQVSRNTRIKFMTDGILLRNIERDFLLRSYSAILIDEAHERTVNTDLILGLICRIVPLRRALWEEQSGDGGESGANGCDHRVESPLKVLIMSATLRVSDFVLNSKMFPKSPPPVIKIQSRQYPVVVHFNRRTTENYVREAFIKVLKIHRNLPAGGILVFLTGEAEIELLVRKLRERLDKSHVDYCGERHWNDTIAGKESCDNVSRTEETLEVENDKDEIDNEDDVLGMVYGDDLMRDEKEGHVESHTSLPNKHGDEGHVESHESLPNKRGNDAGTNEMENNGYLDQKLELDMGIVDQIRQNIQKEVGCEIQPTITMMNARVVPLYSALSGAEQMMAFEPVPKDTRLIVVATNIAETSLTIPGISYVVDCGRVKTKYYEKSSGIINFRVVWTSMASADQRAGRAGRTGPGHCYRLYSSAVYQELSQFGNPQILNMSVDDLVLQMKNMGIEHLEIFPFPTPPDIIALETSHRVLTDIGALKKIEMPCGAKPEYKITPLGRAMCRLPIAPRYSKMLILARDTPVFYHVVALVACLAVGNPFACPSNCKDYSKLKNGCWKQWKSSTSDLLARLLVIGALDYESDWVSFCSKYSLNLKVLNEIRQLRMQLLGIVNSMKKEANVELLAPDVDSGYKSKPELVKAGKLTLPTNKEKVQIRQIITAGLVDRVARYYSKSTNSSIDSIKSGYRTCHGDMAVEIHPSSFLSDESPLPEYLVYNELIQGNRLMMHGVTSIQLVWMPSLCPWLCLDMDIILDNPPPRYDKEKDRIMGCVNPRYVRRDWEIGGVMHPISDTLELYKNFARCFLEGQICEEMKIFQPFLNTSTRFILTNWTQKKVLNIIQPLIDKKVNTRRKLYDQWVKNPKFWLSEVLPWFDKCKHDVIIKSWPPMPRGDFHE